ncbi:hypothetical protein P053_01788 [Brucella abortus 01-4165]|nr:hypothetical protein DO78_18 [Brucella abortus]AIJ60399.1 hypothetical protein DK53_103 [Brucella abortus bv. 9 str. C68]AIJ92593.1 hypothetical protein DK55_107 [Brucella abortus bv. 2 str. 86/8/59]EHR13582.1 hypothetical protein M19_00390 [Brucella abortus bv. 1 str. NI474]EHR19748.1 hypothetical protein M1E_02238 [Brucella abortus bv. 1 str. NI488]EHR22245.1 hypothetical protein M1G_00391 [Brucella abortus bv. 1 str. NI010]EHR22701.1 hypothetical protein M1I_00390 [Brucella abortus bv. 
MHQHSVQPASVLEARTLDASAMGKAQAFMQLHRANIVFAVADHCQQLAKPKGGNPRDEFAQQKLANALPLRIGGDKIESSASQR